MIDGAEVDGARSHSPGVYTGRAGVYAWYVVALLMGVSILAYLDRLVLSFLIDPIKAELHLSDTRAGMLVGLAFPLFYVTMGLPIGYLIDSRPRRLVLAACVVVWSVTTSLSGLASSFGWLFLARCGVGAAEAAVHPAALSIIGDTFPPQRLAGAIAVYGIGLWLGGGLAILLGGELVATFNSLGPISVSWIGGVISAWRLVLACVGLPGLLLAAVIVGTLRDARSPTPARGGNLPGADSRLGQALRAFLRQEYAPFGIMMLGYISFGFVFYNILAWYPAILTRMHGLAPRQVSLAYGIPYLVAGIAGTLAFAPLFGWMNASGRQASPLALAKWCMVIGAVPAVLGPVVTSLPLCVACLVITVFVWSVTVSCLYTAFVLCTPPASRGFMIAAQGVLMNVSAGALGPVLVGALSDRVFGSNGVGFSFGAVALVAMPVAAGLFQLADPKVRALAARMAAT